MACDDARTPNGILNAIINGSNALTRLTSLTMVYTPRTPQAGYPPYNWNDWRKWNCVANLLSLLSGGTSLTIPVDGTPECASTCAIILHRNHGRGTERQTCNAMPSMR